MVFTALLRIIAKSLTPKFGTTFQVAVMVCNSAPRLISSLLQTARLTVLQVIEAPQQFGVRQLRVVLLRAAGWLTVCTQTTQCGACKELVLLLAQEVSLSIA